MIDLIEKYNAFKRGSYANFIVSIGLHPDYPITTKDSELIDYLKKRYKLGECFISQHANDALGQELSFSIAFYE